MSRPLYSGCEQDTVACERTWSELASWTLHSVIARKQNRRSTTSSKTVPSGGNRDTSYGRRMSQPPISCGERQKTCAAPPSSWQHVDWGSKHGWLTAEEERNCGGTEIRVAGGIFCTVWGHWLVGCLTSQQHASVSQGWICSDSCTCCHTEIEAADPAFHRTQSQYTDTGPTSPSTDPIMPGAWQGSHWSTSLKWLVWLSLEKDPCWKQESNPGLSLLKLTLLH